MKQEILLVGCGSPSRGAAHPADLAAARASATLAAMASVRAGSAEPDRVRFVELPDDPERSLLKLIERVDLFLPEAVLVIGFASASREIEVPAWVTNVHGAASDPVDPGGPGRRECSLPAERIASGLRQGGIEAAVSTDAGDSPENRLGFALVRYVELRGGETWFGRAAPAGLSALIGVLRLPGAAPAGDGSRKAASAAWPADRLVRALALAAEEASRIVHAH